MVHVLEHIEDPTEFLPFLHTEKIFIEVPDAIEFELLDKNHDEFNSCHCHFFTPDNLETLLKGCGYKVLENYDFHYKKRDLSRILVIAAMKPDAMETFTPHSMGADANLKEAKKRIGDRVCMIGGFDQFHYLSGCTEQETRDEVRRCFHEAGEGGGFILSPSDHFFEADLNLLEAFADEALKCTY